MSPEVLGFLLLYGVPFGLLLVAAVLLRWLVAVWEGRDVMASMRPDRRRVARTDRAIAKIHGAGS